MRINVYHHEIPFMASRVEHVTTMAADTENTFHGLRMYTEPPLEHEPGDDDSSAITLWVSETDTGDLLAIARAIISFCSEVDGR